MSQKIIYVGVDVDDNSFHATALFPETGEVLEYKTKPTFTSLVTKLTDLKGKFPDIILKICYKATYIGFTLKMDSRI